MRDGDGDGIPQYSWSTLLAPVTTSVGVPRTGIQVNSGRHRPAAPTQFVFWPLLDRPDFYGRAGDYFDTPPTISVDWGAGLIGSLGFAGYPIEEGYHVNSLTAAKRGQVNALSFENPMAYYDLAANRNGIPELFIRTAYTPPGEPNFVGGGPTATPLEMIQYSWSQRELSQPSWDYKIDLAGRNPITTAVAVGDLVVQQVPHDELPRWVRTQPWAFGTFVARESGDYVSSEGIYEWSTLEGVVVDINTGAAVPDAQEQQRAYLTGAGLDIPGEPLPAYSRRAARRIRRSRGATDRTLLQPDRWATPPGRREERRLHDRRRAPG